MANTTPPKGRKPGKATTSNPTTLCLQEMVTTKDRQGLEVKSSVCTPPSFVKETIAF